jgi:phosphatidate cytidylyltransferase
MKLRLLTALLGIAFFIPIIIFSHTLLLPIAAAAFSAMAVFELFRCIGAGKKYLYLGISLAFAVAMPLLVGFLYKSVLSYIGIVAMATCAFLTLMFATLVFGMGKEKFSAVAQMVICVLYVTYGFTSLALLRQLENGFYLFLMPFVVAWMTDSMAYFSGMLFGKHKLCPSVSPKKTVEGAIGGLVLGSGLCLLIAFVLDKLDLVSPNYLFLGVSLLVLSFLSQLGDLFASLIKREYAVKDFGNLFPGHGGVMDRFDSIIFLAPIVILIAGLASFSTFFL